MISIRDYSIEFERVAWAVGEQYSFNTHSSLSTPGHIERRNDFTITAREGPRVQGVQKT